MELVPGFLLYPRVRSKQKVTTGQKRLTNKSSTKSFSNIRAKLEPDSQKDQWNEMQDL
ncbi:unnamed protein product [marine sediment metagenome]|uniref:Uncharacterized protein n=1 Tax=marine sediment metagenome TaxID=412755 RepID=X0TPU4_9ZZZZ